MWATRSYLSLGDILPNLVTDMHSQKLTFLFLKYVSSLSITEPQNVPRNAVAYGCVASVIQYIHTYKSHVLRGYSCSRFV